MASHTMVVSPIVAALVKAEEKLGRNREWRSVNPVQAMFLDECFAKRDELAKFSEKELRNWIDDNADRLNAILKQEGFDIKLDEFEKGEFGVVSILDVLVEWLAKGEKTELHVDGKTYPAVKLNEVANLDSGPRLAYTVFNSTAHPHPVVQVFTKSGDKVCMTVADKPRDGFELTHVINDIRKDLRDAGDYETLKFPMVDLNHQVDISWLIGLWTSDEYAKDWEVSQAMQQTKFKMNEAGARVKSAVAIGIRAMSVMPVRKKHLVIDKPFYLWIERAGVTLPVMCAYIDTTEWKNPGELSNI